MKALAELSTFLAGFVGDLRRRRDFRNVLEVEAAQDITAEATAEARAAAQLAYTARCADDEGLSLLERVTADGVVTPAELPSLRLAMAHIRRSREIDHQLSELA